MATRHPCVAWNLGGRRLADLVVDHLQAGTVVYVEGRLQMPPRAETDSELDGAARRFSFRTCSCSREPSISGGPECALNPRRLAWRTGNREW